MNRRWMDVDVSESADGGESSEALTLAASDG